MTRAKDIGPGDWIKDGIHNGKVTSWPAGKGGLVLITWERGTASGVMGRAPDADVKRVYKPKRRSW